MGYVYILGSFFIRGTGQVVIHIGVGFSNVARSDRIGQCESLYDVDEQQAQIPTSFLYMYSDKR